MKTTHHALSQSQHLAEEIRDNRFMVTNGVMIEVITCSRGQDISKPADTIEHFVCVYDAEETYNPSCTDAISEAYQDKNLKAVHVFTGEEEAEDFALLLVKRALKSGTELITDLITDLTA